MKKHLNLDAFNQLFEEAFKLNSMLKKPEYEEKSKLSDSIISSHDSHLTDENSSSEQLRSKVSSSDNSESSCDQEMKNAEEQFEYKSASDLIVLNLSQINVSVKSLLRLF